uniref:Si:ch211-286b5.2 n=1 Tax=Sinocyclocheilus anshuiensis TaxID=1608454 RepID=A0A671PF22_9TELE
VDAIKCILAEFKTPKRTQPRVKRQKSTEETNLQPEDENKTPESENNNSHNASCSDKLDEHQAGQSTLQVTQTTEFPVDPCCSLEEKTSHDDNVERGNGTNPPEVSQEIEQTAAIPVQTPELDNSNKYTLSRPLNAEAINVDQPDIELENEESEFTSNSNRESQKVPDDCDSELPSDEHQTETAVDQIGIQMPEDAGSADPLVKRKIRKRMGMCWLGEKKKMLKGQPTRGNVFGGGQENEAGQVTNDEPLMMSDSVKNDSSISLEQERVTEFEVSLPSFPASCPLEDIPVQEEREHPDVQYGNEVQIWVECMSSKQIAHETDNVISSHANDDDLNPLEQNEIKCMEKNITQDSVVIDSSLEVLKKANEASASTSEFANHFGEELVVGGNEIEQCCPCECDMNSDHTNEQSVELMDIAANETISAPPVIRETEDKCESSDFTVVASQSQLRTRQTVRTTACRVCP